MNYNVSHPTKELGGSITLTASKSESNRALIIQALCAEAFEIKNLAAAEDTRVLKEILTAVKSNSTLQETTYDVGAAGTTMRFLTAYLATVPGNHMLTGSERMKDRPIGILVNALRDLGASIEYMEKDGYPPLRIKGKELQGAEVLIDGNISSQYISALMLIAPQLKNGLVIKFKGEVTSIPYINMTSKIMEEFGVTPLWSGDTRSITIHKKAYHKKNKEYVFEVEGDWSSASYWYAFAALSNEVNFIIKGLKKNSLQGDAVIASICGSFGIKTDYMDGGIRITKEGERVKSFEFDFSTCPDLAQTVATLTSALKAPSTFTGLHTLRIKETDRTLALKNELAKLGTEVEIISDDSIKINPSNSIKTQQSIATYEDHRMAMAFSVFALTNDSITIEHSEVVKKSYPNFWNDLKSVGFIIKEV